MLWEVGYRYQEQVYRGPFGIFRPTFNLTVEEVDKEYFSQANMTFINNIYATYDKYINKTYKVDINYKAFEKIKNYLR